MSFLTAEWRKLAIANYVVSPEVLHKYLPYGTELDLFDGNCYVSLVGFMFLNTKLIGIKIPFHSNFEEVNLRFYVKRYDGKDWKRGVVFIKEIVPKPTLTFVANSVYNENYETLPMQHEWIEDATNRIITYKWKKKEQWNFIKITAAVASSEIAIASETEFITEHYWGYAQVDEKSSNEYEVTHPKWEKYDVIDYEINVDYGAVYGDEFQFLNQETPASVMLAEGSSITVENKNKLTENDS